MQARKIRREIQNPQNPRFRTRILTRISDPDYRAGFPYFKPGSEPGFPSQFSTRISDPDFRISNPVPNPDF
jgi:hypothetical protein